jgi:DNA polymerase-3 subunit alpha
LEYIPSFVRRKNGEEEIKYDLDACEEYLGETYGITVYQEQVMLLSQSLADFSKGDADVLRKAMGKKDRATLDKMKPKFIEQAATKGHDATVLEKIWKDWEAFASYAFNKSHSTCYAWIAYQTAYLKAHYPAEYMAAVLSNNMNDIKQVSFFMEECKRMGLQVLGPDVNESFYKFTVNENNAVRFGMGAVKGVGANAVDTIVQSRKDAPYKSIFDLAKKIDLRSANKKAFERLAYAGGFDCFTDTHRAQYFHIEGEGITFLEKAMRYGSKFQENENSSQVSLFGEASDIQIAEPIVPPCEEWSTMEKLAREKEVVGIYISGHPLDDYKFEMEYFCNVKLEQLKSLESLVGKTVSFGGIVTNIQHRTAKNGKGWATFLLEGYDESYEFRIFDEEYLKFRHFLVQNQFVYFKVLVKDGWVNRETGKKSDPRIQFMEAKMLADVLPTYAKKLIIILNIKELHQDFVYQLSQIMTQHQGDHSVTFEVLEIEKVKKEIEIQPVINEDTEEVMTDEIEGEMTTEITMNVTETIEENKVITAISMPSRKTKVKISSEFLNELEKLQVNFKLN